jgi:hypothetical protein
MLIMTNKSGDLLSEIGMETVEGDDFEQMLELLATTAKAEGRHFLAYLLTMALMEARNEDFPTGYSHH